MYPFRVLARFVGLTVAAHCFSGGQARPMDDQGSFRHRMSNSCELSCAPVGGVLVSLCTFLYRGISPHGFRARHANMMYLDAKLLFLAQSTSRVVLYICAFLQTPNNNFKLHIGSHGHPGPLIFASNLITEVYVRLRAGWFLAPN